jgi:hypothetical protein
MKTTIQFVRVLVAFFCLSLVGPTAQAVNPPPDGGYPGGNTAEGQAALFGLTSGGYNTAVGFLSLRTDTIGSFNTALGGVCGWKRQARDEDLLVAVQEGYQADG